MNPTDLIEQNILALTTARGPDKSICPSEVARALRPEGTEQDGHGWRSLMTPIRVAAIRLADAGHIEILRKGRPVARDPTRTEALRGVIRLRIRTAT